ncbi:MAG TPA: AbiV family abortive infection protein [Stellaceae bacterium]|nr:AbiV family abortive infection protein [Stellaceae bacterium]
MAPNGLTPKQYAGELSRDAAEAGIEALMANAGRLARDAKILLHARRFASASTLAAMALAEFARVSALLALPAATGPTQTKRAWRHFRDGAFDFPWSMCCAGRPALSDAETNAMISFIRAIGEQVECIGDGAWVEPEKMIGRPLATQLVEMAELLRTHPIDREPLRIWMQVVDSCPEDAADDEVLQRFRGALEREGLGRVAALIPSA